MHAFCQAWWGVLVEEEVEVEEEGGGRERRREKIQDGKMREVRYIYRKKHDILIVK